MRHWKNVTATFMLAAGCAAVGPGPAAPPAFAPTINPETLPAAEITAPTPSPVSSPTPPAASCPPGMALVEGSYCPDLEETCTKWKDAETAKYFTKKLGRYVPPHMCAEFAAPTVCKSPPEKMVPVAVCMDIYEHTSDPVKKLPDNWVTFYDAKKICADEGKRLCTDIEEIKACQGPENKPYPYDSGYTRDATACQIDYPNLDWSQKKINAGDPAEMARVDKRVPVGTYDRCVSDYGVHDLTGSVDEWTLNKTQNGQPYESMLRSGWWGPMRNRCTPTTSGHAPEFKLFNVGFRCCADPAP